MSRMKARTPMTEAEDTFAAIDRWWKEGQKMPTGDTHDHYHPDDHPDWTRDLAHNPDVQRLWVADMITRMVNVENKLRAPMWAIKKGKPAPTYTAEDLFALANELMLPTPVRETLGLPVIEPVGGVDAPPADDQDGSSGPLQPT